MNDSTDNKSRTEKSAPWTVTFNLEGGKSVGAPAFPGESLLDAAKNSGLPIDAPCSGNGSCGKCRVRLLSGDAESPESRHVSPEEFAGGHRLACITKAAGNLTVFVPSSALAYKNRMKITALETGREREAFNALRDALGDMDMFGDTGLELVSLDLPPPTLEDPAADRERLLRAIGEKLGAEAGLSLHALRKLPHLLRNSGFSCLCLVRAPSGEDQKPLVLDLFPPETPPVIPGIAIDIGTTSVSVLLADLKTGEPLGVGNGGNGQIRYGADVIGRIIESAKPGGLERLRKGVIDECIRPLISSLCASAGLEPERICRVAVAGNTTMIHLFLGIPPEFLRLEPYTPGFFDCPALRGGDTGLQVHPDAEVMIAPAIGSYVGGDITAGAFSSLIFKQEALSLLVDLGTNGELVFGNADFLMSCACSAGPAFEGGDISCGMRATDGAVEGCVIDAETMEPSLKIIGPEGQKPLGLCGSGLIDVIGELFRCDIINPKGKISREGPRIQRDEWGNGSYVVAFAGETEHGRDIALTETDIDSFIRAKGAIFSAIKTMLAIMDFPMDALEQVYVSGGIGSGINIKQAIAIGMLPNLKAEQYRYIGNSSLSGAYAMLISRRAGAKTLEVGQSMTYLELSSHPSYMDEFVAACFLPHTDAALFAPHA